MEKMEFEPLVGFGKVKFGMTQSEVEAILGKANEVLKDEPFGEDEDDYVTILNYYELGLSLSFDKVEDYRLTDIMTDGECNIGLPGGIKVGMTEAAFKKAAPKSDMGPFDELDMTEESFDEGNDENLSGYEFYDAGITVYFKEGILDTIQMGPEFDDNDEVVWPK